MSRILVLLSLACCTVSVLSFAFFAADEMAGASSRAQRALNPAIAAAPVTPARGHGEPRRTIEALAAPLDDPFGSLVHSRSAWVARGGELLIALLVYGLGLGFIAHYSRGASTGPYLRRGRRLYS